MFLVLYCNHAGKVVHREWEPSDVSDYLARAKAVAAVRSGHCAFHGPPCAMAEVHQLSRYGEKPTEESRTHLFTQQRCVEQVRGGQLVSDER